MGQAHIKLTKKSKFLALVLRHNPKKIGIDMDGNGWVNVQDLCAKMPIDISDLDEIVRTDQKGRYSYSEDGLRIRANQGHSIEVKVDSQQEAEPPEFLYHGTGKQSLDSIWKDGLKPMNRQHVHLSADKDTAIKVGKRHGKPAVLKIYAQQMHESGQTFWLSANGVWLVDRVDPKDFKCEPI
jgi:putative RNA 2'-phosphotransferase